jgi:hypothetical protein
MDFTSLRHRCFNAPHPISSRHSRPSRMCRLAQAVEVERAPLGRRMLVHVAQVLLEQQANFRP